MTPQPSPGEGPSLTDTDERVARAICRERYRRYCSSPEILEREVGHFWPRFIIQARAARLALSPSPQESVYKGPLEELAEVISGSLSSDEIAAGAVEIYRRFAALSPTLATEEPTT